MRVFGVLEFIGLVLIYVSDYILSALTETVPTIPHTPQMSLRHPRYKILEAYILLRLV